LIICSIMCPILASFVCGGRSLLPPITVSAQVHLRGSNAMLTSKIPSRPFLFEGVETLIFDLSSLSNFMTHLLQDSGTQNHSHLTNLCTRLDYNGFITRSMNEKSKFKF